MAAHVEDPVKLKMRILIDARPVPGGIQRSLDELVERLGRNSSGIDLLLYHSAGGGLVKTTNRRRSPTPIRLTANRRSWESHRLGGLKRLLDETVRLPQLISNAKVDVFLSPNGWIPKNLSCHSVVQCHDLWLLDHPETKRRGWITRYERRTLFEALERADRIVVPSKSTLAHLKDRLPQLGEKVRHIYHPLTKPPPASDPLGNPRLPQQPFLLSVGTLEPRKNLERLVAAQQAIWPKTGVPLVLVGPDGWSQTSLLETINKTPAVRWIGPVDDASLDQLYRQAAAVAQVSLCEGFSYPMVEAMQRGARMVLSDIPVHQEIAGQAAAYCDPSSPASISLALLRVLNWDQNRITRARTLANQRLAELADDSLLNQWLALFNELSS